MKWYRNVNGKYHAERPDWIQSGKAVCGRDIRRPAYTAPDVPHPEAPPPNQSSGGIVRTQRYPSCLY